MSDGTEGLPWRVPVPRPLSVCALLSLGSLTGGRSQPPARSLQHLLRKRRRTPMGVPPKCIILEWLRLGVGGRHSLDGES